MPAPRGRQPPGPPGQLHTVYEAAGPQYRPIDRAEAAAVARRYGIDGDYVLSVGSLEPGKNRARLFRALLALHDDGIAPALVVVGQKAWHFEDDFALVDRLGMRDQVRFLDYVPADDLPALYNAATLFAFPSLYEGFGLPVMEAMACGVPILTSGSSATAEVAAGAAVLVDPQDTDAIRDGLRELLADPLLRDHFARRGLDRAAQFSWIRAAEETHAVYESLLLAPAAGRGREAAPAP